MRLKTGDKVIVIAGSNKGKVGTIKKVLRDENKVIVEGVNIVHKHQNIFTRGILRGRRTRLEKRFPPVSTP